MKVKYQGFLIRHHTIIFKEMNHDALFSFQIIIIWRTILFYFILFRFLPTQIFNTDKKCTHYIIVLYT